MIGVGLRRDRAWASSWWSHGADAGRSWWRPAARACGGARTAADDEAPVRPHPLLPLALRLLRFRLGAGRAPPARRAGRRPTWTALRAELATGGAALAAYRSRPSTWAAAPPPLFRDATCSHWCEASAGRCELLRDGCAGSAAPRRRRPEFTIEANPGTIDARSAASDWREPGSRGSRWACSPSRRRCARRWAGG